MGCAPVITGKLAGVVRGWGPMGTGGAFEAMVRAVRNDGRRAARPGRPGLGLTLKTSDAERYRTR